MSIAVSGEENEGGEEEGGRGGSGGGGMAEPGEHVSSFMETVSTKIHEYKELSSSDSDGEGAALRFQCNRRLFGRTEPVHVVLGGGKSADIILWRNKQLSGVILAGVTVIWLLFECLGYHLVTLLCHLLILLLAVAFIWSNAASLLNRSPPKFSEVVLPEQLVQSIAGRIRYEINEALATFHYVASGKDLKAFLLAIAGLWVASVVGGWFSFLTFSYIAFMALYTLPVLYEMYQDRVDEVADKVFAEVKKYYAVLDDMVLNKIPRGPFGDKKQN